MGRNKNRRFGIDFHHRISDAKIKEIRDSLRYDIAPHFESGGVVRLHLLETAEMLDTWLLRRRSR